MLLPLCCTSQWTGSSSSANTARLSFMSLSMLTIQTVHLPLPCHKQLKEWTSVNSRESITNEKGVHYFCSSGVEKYLVDFGQPCFYSAWCFVLIIMHPNPMVFFTWGWSSPFSPLPDLWLWFCLFCSLILFRILSNFQIFYIHNIL